MLMGNVMSQLDIEKFVGKLRSDALPPYGSGRCAKFVRLALEHGGAVTAGHPRDAKDWGPTLTRTGFRSIAVLSPLTFVFSKGDVAVIQAIASSSSGHIQGFDGTNWISDFVQPDGFWPGSRYRNENPNFVVYRP